MKIMKPPKKPIIIELNMLKEWEKMLFTLTVFNLGDFAIMSF